MYKSIQAYVICAVLLAPASAWATHPLIVQDTVTEGKGNFLLEITGDYTKSNELKSTLLKGIITAGTGDHTDVSLEVPYLMLNPGPVPDQDASGTGDVRIKFMHRLFENEVRQSMGFQVYSYLPTGDADKGLGAGNFVWGALLMDSQKCRNNVLHLNAGYEVFGRDVKNGHFAQNYAILFGIAAEHGITGSFRFLAEVAGESRKESGVYSRPLTFLGGVVYDLSRSWYVDLGARAGLNKYAEDYTVLAGTALRF